MGTGVERLRARAGFFALVLAVIFRLPYLLISCEYIISVTSPFVPLLVEEASRTSSMLASVATHFAIGGGLFLGVQKLLEEFEKKLNADTKLEIAVWLLDLRPTATIQTWRSTLPKIFNLVFGEKHLSWKCFWRSCLVTAFVTLIVMLARTFISPTPTNVVAEAMSFVLLFSSGVLGSILPDYVSLWKTRYLVSLTRDVENFVPGLLFLAIDVVASFALAVCAAFMGTTFLVWIGGSMIQRTIIPIVQVAERVWAFFWPDLWTQQLSAVSTVWFIPAFFGRLWILSFVGCGLLLRVARRLDIGFEWFNRRFDVENNPLQCIGLIAGALLALSYWLLAAIHVLP